MSEEGVVAPVVAPWRDRRFQIFAAGNFANNLGEAAYNVALPLFVYELTGSLATMALLAALSPMTLLLSPALGAVVDRWGPRVFVVPGLLVQFGAALALNLSVLAGHASTAVIFSLAALVQLGGEAYRAGWMAGVPGMFPRNAARSRAVLSSLFVTSNVVGPLLVAIGIGPLGYLGLLWFNTATFVAPIVVWLVGVHPPARDRPAAGGWRNLGRDVADGWRVVRAEKRVLYVKLTALPLHFASGVGVLSFMVWYLRDHWHLPASGVSTVQAVASVGALTGSLLIVALVAVRSRTVLAVAAIGMTVSLLGMMLPTVWGFVTCMVVFFTLRSAMTATSEMIIVKYLPAEVIGRAAGVFNLIDGIPILIAPLLVVVIERWFGANAVLVFLFATAAISLICIARYWSRWDERRQQEPSRVARASL